jgi:hypothetical protein
MIKIEHIFFLFFVFLLSCDTENNTKPPAESYFLKFYGEDGFHEGVDFVAGTDGSFFLLGNKILVGDLFDQQVYLVKVDAVGNVLWQRSFGMAGDDFAKDIELTLDGNIIFAAESRKGPNNKDVYLKKVSLDGAPLDSVRIALKTIDNQEADETVNSITVMQSGYIVSGSTTAVKTLKSDKPNDVTDAMHLRFTNALVLIDPNTGLWINSSGNDDSEDVLTKMIEVNPFTYYGFGYTNTIRGSTKDYKYWIFSLGATGLPTDLGTELLDAIGNAAENEKLSGVIKSPNVAGEGFILSGIKTDATGSSKSFVVKLQNRLFVPGEDNVLNEESPTDVGINIGGQVRMASLTNGGFLLLSNSRVAANDENDISLIKLSNTLLKEWQEPVFFGGVGDDFAGSVMELPDGKIMIIGTMTLGGELKGQTKMVLIKLNSNGRLSD